MAHYLLLAKVPSIVFPLDDVPRNNAGAGYAKHVQRRQLTNLVKRLRCDASSVGDGDHSQFLQRVAAASVVCEILENFVVEGFLTGRRLISNLKRHQIQAGGELPEIDTGAIHVNQIDIYHPAKAWAGDIQEEVYKRLVESAGPSSKSKGLVSMTGFREGFPDAQGLAASEQSH